MLAKMLLAALLRLHNPTQIESHTYTVTEAFPDKAAGSPYYTKEDWDREMARKTFCRCWALKILPNGTITGRSRPCNCGE